MSRESAEAVQSRFPEDVCGILAQPGEESASAQWRVDIRKDALLSVLAFAKNTLGLTYLADITAVDYLNMPEPPAERFGLIYVLRSLEKGELLIFRALVPENDTEVESATSLWRGANWLEREIFDLFGISFRNHPNMIRILMPENFDYHPLRKDFPAPGVGYRDNFPIVPR
jgi:NADH-quinone oxidoreductase subunit C